MKKYCLALIALVLFSSHDMFLKFDSYFLQPDRSATLQLFNGTFHLSENTIDRNRMGDVSLVGNDRRIQVDSTQWREEQGVTILDFKTGKTGTWVAGVSTLPRNIELTASDFNEYLEHDGVLDMIKWRKENNALDQDAVEKYSKHVKAIFQVGDKKTNDWETPLGYPIEFIPLSNPYDLHAGHELQVKLLLQGKPLANQLVYIGSDQTADQHTHEHEDGTAQEHSHDNDQAEESDHEHTQNQTEETTQQHTHEHEDGTVQEHSHDNEQAEAPEEDHQHQAVDQVRTDAEGKLIVTLATEGLWYLRTIHMTQSENSEVTHESNWATLTFAVGHGHSEADGTHTHDGEAHVHEDEHADGIPSYIYWIGSLVLFAGLFFWFNKRKAG